MSNFLPVLHIGRLIRYITGRTKGIKRLGQFQGLSAVNLLHSSVGFVLPYHPS